MRTASTGASLGIVQTPSRRSPRCGGWVSQDALIRGRLTLDQLHRRLVAAHGLRLTLRDFNAVWREPYSAPMPGMAALLRTLAVQYRLVLLSNVDRDYWAVVHRAHAELDCFDAHLLSWDRGLAKPEAAFFQQAIAACGSSASRCFFFDDKCENIDAALRLGLQAHRFSGVTDLLEVLQRLGIGSA